MRGEAVDYHLLSMTKKTSMSYSLKMAGLVAVAPQVARLLAGDLGPLPLESEISIKKNLILQLEFYTGHPGRGLQPIAP